MKCKACNYALWNLPDRRCPECGKDFFPSQFDFVPRSVRFLCPFCKQQYFGTDEHGHLVPRTFTCVSCSNRINMDEMILLPAEGVDERLTVRELNPWLDRHQRGVLNRWFATIGRSMTAPTRLIQSTPAESSTGKAFGFAMINIVLTFVVAIATLWVYFSLMPMGPVGLGALTFFGLFLGVGFGIQVAWLMLWMLLTHGLLRIMGRLPGGMRATCRCMWYSSGPYMLAAVPCVGVNVLIFPAVIWWGVCAAIMLSKEHKIGGLRATIATFGPALVIGFAVVVSFVAWARSTATFTMASAAAYTSMQQARANSMSMALWNFKNINNSYPVHGAELIDGGIVSGAEFSLSTDPLAADAIAVGATTMGKLELAQPGARKQVLQQVGAAMPVDVIAHRVGDYVFTYHQLPSAPDPGLWLFIADEPPPPPNAPISTTNASPATPSVPLCFVGLPNGRITQFPKTSLSTALQKQNALRATFNLPPLPDPTTVTLTSPATAPK